MTYETLKIIDDGATRTIVINRPEVLNALSPKVMSELASAFAAAMSEPMVRVVLLTGAGERAFVAGADIAAMSTMTPVEAEALARAVKAATNHMRRGIKPVVAVINGHCLGGGLELALACDIRIACDAATFGLPEIKLGILPGGGGTIRLGQVIGHGPARNLILSGDTVKADRALALGLVSEVHPRDQLAAAAKALADRLAGYSAHALAQAKESMNAGLDSSVDAAEVTESKAFALCYGSPDAREGLRAFVEKRPPKFNQT